MATRVAQLEAAASKAQLSQLLLLISSGISYQGSTPAIPALCIPKLTEQDGDAGIHSTSAAADATFDHFTQLPMPIATGAAWDRGLSAAYGRVIGTQAKTGGVDFVGAPDINVIRTSLAGRASESLSEDPYLTMSLGVSEDAGIQGAGEGAYLKHYAAYNQEKNRSINGDDDSIVSQQALREVYLPAFSAIVQRVQPAGIMCAYNSVNGQPACGSTELLQTILRKEWGYQGFVRTDCLNTQNTPASFDWPGWVKAEVSQTKCDTHVYNPATMAATYSKATLETLAGPLLTSMFRFNLLDHPNTSPPQDTTDQAGGYQTALKTDNEGSVLLRNVDNLLPLPKSDSVELVGAVGGAPDLIVGGSPRVAAPVDLPADVTYETALRDVWGSRLHYVGVNGVLASGNVVLGSETPTPAQIAAAAAEARHVNVAVVVVSQAAHEAIDRTTSALPASQVALVAAVAKANPNTVVVVDAGQAVYLRPFEGKVKAILSVWYPGEAAGRSLAEILDGQVDPSGKLPITWPATAVADQAVSAPKSFGGVHGRVDYDLDNNNGVSIGYRWYATHHVRVAFPFGFGLSYTSFAWSDVKVVATAAGWTVTANVTNTGKRAGAAISELYLSQPPGQTGGGLANEPPVELRGFYRAELAPGQTKPATFNLTPGDLAHFDSAANSWRDVAGTYTIHVGGSLRNLPLSAPIQAQWRNLGVNSGPTP